MAKSSGKGNQGFLLLVLLGIIAGGGAWNYHRNLKLEEAEPRPYRSYSRAQLEDLAAAYRRETDAHSQRYQTASSRSVNVRSGGMIGEQVNEFERVQRISRGKRAIADQYAKNHVQLDGVMAELSKRASEGALWQVLLTRLTKYP
jgi:hypothetical protein